MTEFKIYDTLVGLIEGDGDFKMNSQTRLTINKMNKQHRDLIYAIIYHYHVTNDRRTSNVPYNGTVGKSGKGVTFNVTNLPKQLQQIIVAYVKVVTGQIKIG